MGVQIYLAGAETPTLTRDLIGADVKHILYSYFYIRQGNKQETFADIFANNPDKKFILDSGAFTYQVMWADLEKRGRLPPPEEYWKSYLEFARKYGHLCFGVAEFDIDGMVPDTTLQDWREQLIEAVGDKAMPVWHPERSVAEWKRYVADPRLRYLGMASSIADIGQMQRLITEAHAVGKIVHGFAQTKVNTVLKYVRFDTVDSTSWLSAQKFGQTFIFRHNKFIVLDKADMGGKTRRRLFKSYFEQIGCDWTKIDADDVKELRKASIIAWKNLAARMASMRWPIAVDKQIQDRDGTVVSPTGSVVDVEERELDAHMSPSPDKKRKFKIPTVTAKTVAKKNGLGTVDVTTGPDGSTQMEPIKPPKKVSRLAVLGKAMKAQKVTQETKEMVCEDCAGEGEFFTDEGDSDGDCTTCNGTGKIVPPEALQEANSDKKLKKISRPVTAQPNEGTAIKRGPKTKMVPPSKAGWKAMIDGTATHTEGETGGTKNGPEIVFGEGQRLEEIEGDLIDSQRGETDVGVSTPIPEVGNVEAPPASDTRQRGLARPGDVEEDPLKSELAVKSGHDPVKALQLVKLNIVPAFMCSSCFIAQSCPEYKEGFVCAFNKAFTAFDVRDVSQIEDLMEQIVEKNKVRTYRALLSEELVSGGQLDLNVTRQTDVLLRQLKELRDLKQNVRKVSVTVEEGSKGGGGIFSRLFGAATTQVIEEPKVVNAVPEKGASVTISTEIPVNLPKHGV